MYMYYAYFNKFFSVFWQDFLDCSIFFLWGVVVLPSFSSQVFFVTLFVFSVVYGAFLHSFRLDRSSF